MEIACIGNRRRDQSTEKHGKSAGLPPLRLRRDIRILVSMPSQSFKKQYIFLATLILASLALALLTLTGLDPRIGWIATGFTLGAQVAVHMVRSAEVRLSRITKELEQQIDDNRSLSAQENVLPTAVTINMGAGESESPSYSQQPVPITAAVGTTPFESPQTAPEEPQVPVVGIADRCACACGCELDSKGGFEGLCSDCRRLRLEQGLECECDYTLSSACTCGVVQHQPVEADSLLVAAG